MGIREKLLRFFGQFFTVDVVYRFLSKTVQKSQEVDNIILKEFRLIQSHSMVMRRKLLKLLRSIINLIYFL